MSTFKEKLYNVRRNPALMQQIALEELDQQLNGKGTYDVPDATIPFVASMECGTLETSMAIGEFEAQMRMLYSSLALTPDEVYRHMTDDDFLDRFATPAQTTFLLYLGYDEVISKAVAYGNQGQRKLVIPRLTEFSAAGIPFTMQYPIELRVMRHGGLQIVYDGTDVSPVETLRTNIVDWDMVLLGRNKVIRMRIPVKQFRVASHTEALSPGTLYEASLPYENNFYFARAYLSTDNPASPWREVTTTHSDQVFDPMDMTVVFTVAGDRLQVSIPTIYTNTGMARGTLRVDVYSTLGEIDRALGDYKPEQFSALFNATDDDTTYVSPLNTFSIKQALNTNRVTGGSNSIDFGVLRQRVIDNTLGDGDIPITGVQLEARLDKRGYTLVSNIDNITDRQFLASRRLGTPQALAVTSGAGCVMSQLLINMATVASSAHVADNGDRITIKPSMLYTFTNGKVTMLSDAEILQINAMNSEGKARWANENRSVYTPFHYVMDATNNNFDFRPYYLDNPAITEKTFVGENDTAGFQAAVSSYDISRIEDGYRVRVRLDTGKSFKDLGDDQVVVQLGYLPLHEESYASMNGTLIGLDNGERVYQFDVKTNYDIDDLGGLYTTNMSIFSADQFNFRAPLNTHFDVSICIVDAITPGYQENAIDAMVQAHLMPLNWMVVTRERLETTLGYDMSAIWRRNRTVLSEESYKKWENNIPAVWADNIYETDETGATVITIGPNGEVITNLLHAKGSPQLTPSGDPIYAHLAGDPVIVDDKPVLVEARKLLREVTMLMIEGLFYFATEKNAVAYRTEIPMSFVSWLESDLQEIADRLLEKGKLFLYPTQTFGDTVVTVREGQQATIRIDQAFAISFYLTPADYTNTTLRPALVSNGKANIDERISRKTVSRSDIVTRLEDTSGDGVLGLEFSGLGGKENYPVLTVEDDAVSLSIRKKITVLANQELTVEDDVTTNFLKHEVLD
jgi:hypothetical protein